MASGQRIELIENDFIPVFVSDFHTGVTQPNENTETTLNCFGFFFTVVLGSFAYLFYEQIDANVQGEPKKSGCKASSIIFAKC